MEEPKLILEEVKQYNQKVNGAKALRNYAMRKAIKEDLKVIGIVTCVLVVLCYWAYKML